MERLPENAIDGVLETSVINDPKFRKFILKKVKRGNRNIHRLIDELKRDDEFREAVRARAEKLEQNHISLKHMPNDIKAYSQLGILALGILIIIGLNNGLSELEKTYDIYFGFFSTTSICLFVIFILAYIAKKL